MSSNYSISKRQAEALAEGFLDDIGSSKSLLRPKALYTELFLLVGELIEAAQDNLNDADLVNTGKGSKSIQGSDPVKNDNIISVDVTMAFYLQFHNKGVKGTRSGSSRAGYSFKNEIVSEKMYNAIAKWIKRSRRSTRTIRDNQDRTYGKHETRRTQIAQIDQVYAKARSIKMYGLRDTGFMDKAIQTTERKMADRLGAALIVDLEDGLRNA